jgi:hypothetical protein
VLPQAPQFPLSVWRSTQTGPQQVCPDGQTQPHTPLLHIFAVEQTTPQAPQFVGSV